jgi:hypothetical protein
MGKSFICGIAENLHTTIFEKKIINVQVYNDDLSSNFHSTNDTKYLEVSNNCSNLVQAVSLYETQNSKVR